MNKKTLTLALVAASLAVTCVHLVADVRVEAVGVAPSHLTACPQRQTVAVSKYHQYNVFGHFSSLTLGDQPAATRPRTIILSGSAQVIPSTPRAPSTKLSGKSWNRLWLDPGSGKGTALDLFKSSSRTHSTTGTLLTYIPKNKISNWAKAAKAPTVSIDGNTKNPSGKIILCVDFVPRPRIPVGRILLNGNTPRNGEKIAVTWKIYR